MSSAGEENPYGYGSDTSSAHQIFDRPRGWRGVYYHPATQVCLLGLVCFMCPGMFNALTGLGAGGQIDATSSANANSALYATFAFCAFFSGSVVCSVELVCCDYLILSYVSAPFITWSDLGSAYSLGPGVILSTSRLTCALFFIFCLYRLQSLTTFDRATNINPALGDYVVVSGAILGACAGLVWTAQGSLMMAYPTEAEKGTFIGYFWGIFNLGGVVGSAVAFGSNFHSTVNPTCYISCTVL